MFRLSITPAPCETLIRAEPEILFRVCVLVRGAIKAEGVHVSETEMVIMITVIGKDSFRKWRMSLQLSAIFVWNCSFRPCHEIHLIGGIMLFNSIRTPTLKDAK